MGEGDDLGVSSCAFHVRCQIISLLPPQDILSASSALYLHFSAALSAFSTHELSVREQMKSVRTREESLDALRRRRKSLASDAESAERKLSKMNPDHKNLQAQTDLLNKLREDIRVMDTEIMAEEASLGDFKRSSAKTWMGLKFGGLVECCEKGAVRTMFHIPCSWIDPCADCRRAGKGSYHSECFSSVTWMSLHCGIRKFQ